VFWIYFGTARLSLLYSVGIIKDLGVGFAEQTFIVLDKEMLVGEFTHGDPHVEGQLSLQPFCQLPFVRFLRNWGVKKKKTKLLQSAR
jgi:hypothetical protein